MQLSRLFLRNIGNYLIWLILLWAIPSTAHGNPILPEFYGVYALDKGKLTELSEDTPEKMRRNFSGDINLVIFDKRIGSGNITTKQIEVHKRAFVRNQVVSLTNAPNRPAKKTYVKPADRFITLEKQFTIRFKPAKGEQEILIAVPKNSLQPGLYTLFVGKQEYFFAVGIGDFTEKDSPFNNCLDEYVITIDHNAKYSHSQFLALSSLVGGKRVDGFLVYKSSYEFCAASSVGQPSSSFPKRHYKSSKFQIKFFPSKGNRRLVDFSNPFEYPFL